MEDEISETQPFCLVRVESEGVGLVPDGLPDDLEIPLLEAVPGSALHHFSLLHQLKEIHLMTTEEIRELQYLPQSPSLDVLVSPVLQKIVDNLHVFLFSVELSSSPDSSEVGRLASS